MGNEKQTTLNFMMPLESTSATKTFTWGALGEDDKPMDRWLLTKSYKAGKHFKGFSIPVSSIEESYDIIKGNQDNPVFMIHGEFIDHESLDRMLRRKRVSPIDNEPATIRDRMVRLFCLDVDGYDGNNIEEFITTNLPECFHKADYIYQYSSSHGLTASTLKCHLFYWLEEEVFNVDIKNWLKAFNKAKGWGNMLDESVLVATQPVYIQKRICEGAPDPVDDFIGFVKKEGALVWSPENISTVYSNSSASPRKSGGNLEGLFSMVDGEAVTPEPIELENEEGNLGNMGQMVSLSGGEIPFDLATATREIVQGKRFHDNVRGMALSFLNNGIYRERAKDMIQGIMSSVPENEQDDRWLERYQDIERLVDTAANVVDAPDLHEVQAWVMQSNPVTLQAEFADKVVKFDAIDRVALIEQIGLRLGVGKRPINAMVKMKDAEIAEEQANIARTIATEQRTARGVLEIELRNDNYGHVTQKIAQAMSQTKVKPEVFVMGKTLCTIGVSRPKTVRQIASKNENSEDYPKMPIINPIDKPTSTLRYVAEKSVWLVNEKGSSVVAPDSIFSGVPKALDIKWKPISGVIEHPFVNFHWGVTQKDGYDPKTGLYTMLHHKLKLTKIDPKEAYNYLAYTVFDEFPFDTDLDRASAVACLMSAIQRPIISGENGMPGYAMVSPSPSSGKTTLCQLINWAIYNRPVAATSFSDNDEEMGKHLLSILREGHSTILFDNLKKDCEIKSDELAKAMTSSTYSRRLLGENETEEVPSNVLWLFTGNNVRFKGDFATRVIPIRIVVESERPEDRVFKRGDIGQWAQENRKKIISAVISIIFGGKDIPEGLVKTSSRFKHWDRMVRLPLLMASGLDVLEKFHENSYADDDTTSKNELVLGLLEEFGDNPFTSKDVFSKLSGVAQEQSNDDGNLGAVMGGAFNSDGSSLREMVVDSFGEKAATSLRSLGRGFLGMVDYIAEGYRFIKLKKERVTKWKIVKMNDET